MEWFNWKILIRQNTHRNNWEPEHPVQTIGMVSIGRSTQSDRWTKSQTNTRWSSGSLKEKQKWGVWFWKELTNYHTVIKELSISDGFDLKYSRTLSSFSAFLEPRDYCSCRLLRKESKYSIPPRNWTTNWLSTLYRFLDQIIVKKCQFYIELKTYIVDIQHHDIFWNFSPVIFV